MTAVARIAIEDQPMLVADLLLSGPPLPGVIAALPTTNDLSSAFPSGSSKVPRALCQKIAVVSDDLLVGWSGLYDIARKVIGELRTLATTERLTYGSLDQHLNNLDPSIWADIGLVGFIRDPDGRIAQFGRGYVSLPTHLFGNIALLGTGRDHFRNFLHQTEKLPEAAERPMNALERSVGFGLHMGGTLLRIELESPESLKKFYGGGYEIAVFEMGKFKKIEDITYAFWWVETDGPEVQVGRAPNRTFRYSYKDDLLRIRSVTIDDNKHRAPRITEELFRVPPVYRDLRPDEATDTSRPTLNTPWLCNYFLVRSADDQLGILSMIKHQTQQQQWVRFEDFAGGVKVFASQAFFEEMAQHVLRQSGVIKS